MEYLTTSYVAGDLGLSVRTVRKYCKSGFLPAKAIWIGGKAAYRIYYEDYISWKHLNFSGLSRGQINRYTRHTKELLIDDIKDLASEWNEWCLTGKLTGKPLSTRTVEIYQGCFELYLKKLGPRPPKPLVSVENIRTVLGNIPIESFSTRRNTYDSLRSFCKFLIEKDLLKEEVRDKIKKLKPRRFLPPKKTSLNKDQIDKLIQQIDQVWCYTNYDKATSKAIITLLVGCGLRNSEACNLKLKEVDFESRTIFINLGKGNKNRRVGIPQNVFDAMFEYLKLRLEKFKDMKFDNFFLNRNGEPFNNKVIARKVSRLAKAAELDITPHGLRRSFASLYSASGKPLNHLRIALGHADLSTTQEYIMTTESEVVESMREW